MRAGDVQQWVESVLSLIMGLSLSLVCSFKPRVTLTLVSRSILFPGRVRTSRKSLGCVHLLTSNAALARGTSDAVEWN